MIWLYGDAKITYGAIELEADEIIIDYANNTLTAHGSRDSLGNRIGYPVFKNGAELYETKDIIYNFKTKRARISEVVTKQGDGIVGVMWLSRMKRTKCQPAQQLYDMRPGAPALCDQGYQNEGDTQ